jgi:hypothetical protein
MTFLLPHRLLFLPPLLPRWRARLRFQLRLLLRLRLLRPLRSRHNNQRLSSPSHKPHRKLQNPRKLRAPSHLLRDRRSRLPLFWSLSGHLSALR